MAIKTLTGGAFQDSGGNAIALGSISFQLSTPAVVSGTGQVVQDVVITYNLDASGNIVLSTPTPSLWGNDQLTPTGTFYSVNIYNASGALVRGPENWVLQGSSPISLTSITPATPAVSYPGAVLTNPGANQTISTGSLTVTNGVIANLTGDVTSTGTSTFATENTKVGNQIRFADQFAGADMGAKIQAAHDDLPSTGGIVDARGIVGTQTWSTTAALSKPCVLFLGMGTFTYTGTTQAISASTSNVYIKGSGRFSTVIKYAGATTIDLIKFRNGNAGIAYIGVYDLNTRFDSGAKASGSSQIHLYDPVSFELANLYLSVDGTASTMVNRGIVVENVNTGLVPPRGNGRIANITHSNSHDGSAASGAIAIYLKGIAAQALQQIALEGEADIESSWVGLQCEYTSQSNLTGAWYISGNNTNIKLLTCIGWVFVGPNLNFAITENFNIDSGCTDVVILNPVYQTTTTLGTDSGTRTSNLNSRGTQFNFGTDVAIKDKLLLDSSAGQINTKASVVLGANSVSAPTTYGQLTGTFTGARVFTLPDQSIAVSGLQVVGSTGTIATAAKVVTGTGSLVSGTPSTLTITLSGGATFTSNATYQVFVTNKTTAANGLKVTLTDGTHFTITGPNTVSDSVSWVAIGN